MTVQVDLTLARKSMLARAKAMLGVGREAVAQAASDAMTAARATTAFKDRSTRTRGSITAGFSGPNVAFVKAGFAARFLENGTGRFGPRGSDYVIRPKKKRALSFVVNGARVFTKRVTHPGIKATHFLRNAAEQQRRHFHDLAVQYTRAALKG